MLAQLSFSTLDVVTFVGFLVLVVAISLYASRKEDTSEDYFLAGRGLSWWLIGFSLIASNISTEQIVGLAGGAHGPQGLAVASWEWLSSIAMVLIALFLLPVFLKLGLYTMPQFLEQRYSRAARIIMAVYTICLYVGVLMSTVIFAGGGILRVLFDIKLAYGVFGIGAISAAYTIYGGLKAVVWSDLIQGVALILGSALVMVLGFQAVGGYEAFAAHNADKLHMILPASNPDLPWTVLLLGIWIPITYYWGANQYITQRTLGSKSLSQGQLGLIFAGALKILMPFIIVFPGIMAWQLYGDQLASHDDAYAVLIKNLLPAGLRGVLFAALLGAIMSSLDSMSNSAATIFTVDLYQTIRPKVEARTMIGVGRIVTGVTILVSCFIALSFDHPKFKGVFNHIQMYQGLVSPGVLAAFLFGIVVRRAPSIAGTSALVLCVPVYAGLLWAFPDVAFVNLIGCSFLIILAVMIVLTLAVPRAEPWQPQHATTIDLTPSKAAVWLGGIVILVNVALYVVFW